MSKRIWLAFPVTSTLLACGILDRSGSKSSLSPEDEPGMMCAAVRGSQRSNGVNTGPLPDGCAKIEGSQLGQDGIQLDVGGVTVTITRWISKDGEPGEYVGFTYTAGGDVDVTIKAGGEVFAADDSGTWVHPNGTSGSSASAISNIVACPGDEPPGDEPPGDEPPGDEPPGDEPPGDEPPCDDPCGCDGGGEPPGDGTGDTPDGDPCDDNSDCMLGSYCNPSGVCAAL